MGALSLNFRRDFENFIVLCLKLLIQVRNAQNKFVFPKTVEMLQFDDESHHVQERPPTHLKNGIGEEKHIVFQRPRQHVRKRNPARKTLLAYENKPRYCVQLRDQLKLRAKNLVGHSCCSISCVLVGFMILSAVILFGVKATSPASSFPEFQLNKLKHPLYQTAYLDPESDEFFGDYVEMIPRQMAELESFMQFNNYTNIERRVSFTRLENGTKVWNKVPSYSPDLDLTGPGSWMPMQCYTNVTYKYKSPLIAIINHGTRLEYDLLSQIKSIFHNQEGISLMAAELAKFQAASAASMPGDSGEALNETKVEAEPAKDPNVFTVPEYLIQAGGGAPEDPHPPVIENLGKFQYRSFESKEKLFEYAQQDGYGWNPEIPAVCFAFEVHENEKGNKFELELFFRDQWPKMYSTMERLDDEVAPIRSAANILGYTRAAYDGLNLFQTFAANSILQRKLSPQAEIIMMTIPYKIPPFGASPFKLFAPVFLSFLFAISFAPLAFYLAYSLAKEKETGLRQTLFNNGLGRLTHFFSWLLFYTLLNLVLSLIYTLTMKPSIYVLDQFLLIYIMVFLAVQSLFSFVWALQPLTNTTRMALFVLAFSFFISYMLTGFIDQDDGAIELEAKQRAALSPLAAIKHTIDTYNTFFKTNFPATFDNYGQTVKNWSIKEGMRFFVINFFLYLAIGIVLEILVNGYEYFKRMFRMRKVLFEDSNMGLIEVTGLKERGGKADMNPVYNFKIEKSQICCLIGNDGPQRTRLLEMLAGLRPCEGQITIHDSDFFVRGKTPNLSEFLVYRPADVILDDTLTAIDHLNMFAHLRGSEKNLSTCVLCDKLLPEKVQVKFFSESQRQTLQTLIAVTSDNSRIVILDEPTRGLGPSQQSEIIKMLWRFKKDKYLIVQSSDAELVNVLTDEVAKVSQTVETVNSRDINQHEIGSYKLIVEVENGKPSDYLIRYLWKDVPHLTLEYHTELLTYYILHNISKAVLFQKTFFMENNMSLLGLIDFEVVSLPAFEVAQRNMPQNIPSVLCAAFEESFSEQEYAVSQPVSRHSLVEQKDEKSGQQRRNSIVDHAEDVTDNDVLERYNRIEIEPSPAQGKEQQKDRPPTPEEPTERNACVNNIEEDPEMNEFLKLTNEPLKQPDYRRDFFYDFKNQRTKRKFGPFQCPAICRRHVREHWHNKARFLSLLILPALYVFVAWHCMRYYRHKTSGSQLLSPEWLPQKQPILVNEKTQVGGKETKKWIEGLPNSQEWFAPTYVNTTGDMNFRGFWNAIFDFGTNMEVEQPWSQGSYQFYEMDEERHKYKIMTYCNLTAPHSTALYPQFIIESVMKTVLQDNDFEFKVRLSALPIPKEILDKGAYMEGMEFRQTKDHVSNVELINTVGTIGWDVIGCITIAWFMLNSFFMVQIISDRTTLRKHFAESHGQSKFFYWLARYVHDLIFFLPVSLVAVKMLATYEPQMEVAPKVVFLQPFAMLPFLYVVSHLFKREVLAVAALFCYQVFVQWFYPYLLVFGRMSVKIEQMADLAYRSSKLLPTLGATSSMLNNKELLHHLGRFREKNTQGPGEPIETDENHAMNGAADLQWTFIHLIFFWVVLLVFIEWRLPCIFCSGSKRITQEENDKYFQEQHLQTDEDAESSEVAQICGEGKDVEVRFSVKQKPRKELAYSLQGFSLQKGGFCCGRPCRKPSECVISDLSAQVQAGTKFAIISDGSQGKTSILETLTNRESALQAVGVLKKQIGRRSPVYTSQSYEMLMQDLTLAENISFFVSLGSVQPHLASQMLVAFGLHSRRNMLVRNLDVSEKHLTMLILALAGSNRTCILDEPFTALSHEQTIKLVKIIRQKYDCTLIVTAKSKSQLELLQPHSILRISRSIQTQDEVDSPGYLLAFRLKAKECIAAREATIEQALGEQKVEQKTELPKQDDISREDLLHIINSNLGVFEQLKGKKKSTVSQVVAKVMQRAHLSQEVSEEIGDMVHEDLELQATSEELALKCELIISLYKLIEAFCKRFGEVHLEQRQDDYAVVRVVFNERHRLKGLDDSFYDQNPVFSSVVDFVNSNDTVEKYTTLCHFLSARNSSKTSEQPRASSVKVFRYFANRQRIERVKTTSSSRSKEAKASSRL